ncbi:hypothetical protein A6R68_07805 [Neotoma lepida]|uniref:2'-5'-oligoadenylate synthetase 1 domain-containing protein n=1 Tax=Neotoma lepida TaxID=56216 RepID=A0A1A6GBP5_NEOLE|nr:hypothetical protein A6R68_07805 [Neotoma lepida]
MGQGLSNTPALELDEFIEDHLQPNTSFHNEVRAVTDVMCDFLKERCFRDTAHPVRVSKVVKVSPPQPQLTQLQQLSSGEVAPPQKDHLRNGSVGDSPRKDHSYNLTHNDFADEPDCSVCFYSKPDPEIYRKLISECTALRKEGEFSTCFTELQHNFLKYHSPKLKSLICLVKHWYQLCEEKLGKLLPPSMPWSCSQSMPGNVGVEPMSSTQPRASGQSWNWSPSTGSFESTRQYIMTLKTRTSPTTCTVSSQKPGSLSLHALAPHREVQTLAVEMERWELRVNGAFPVLPVILDPADPTRNVAGRNPVGWCLLAQEAAAWLEFSCVRICDRNLVPSWDVPRHSLHLFGEYSHNDVVFS